jgi:hypothetical protein
MQESITTNYNITKKNIISETSFLKDEVHQLNFGMNDKIEKLLYKLNNKIEKLESYVYSQENTDSIKKELLKNLENIYQFIYTVENKIFCSINENIQYENLIGKDYKFENIASCANYLYVMQCEYVKKFKLLTNKFDT